MIRWEKICCAVDFGSASRVAMEAAADIARRFEAELTLVHVAAPPLRTASDVLVSSRTLAQVEAAEDLETLERWRSDAERRTGHPVATCVLSGVPADEIVGHAREHRCDLVVLGTHGRRGIPHAILGSVAERVVQRCGCPVLVVHDHDALEEEDFAAEAAQYH